MPRKDFDAWEQAVNRWHATKPVTTNQADRSLAVLGLDPESLYPHKCDLCGDEEGVSGEKQVIGRWWVHEACHRAGVAQGLCTVHMLACEWEWVAGAPLACPMQPKREREKPGGG